MLVSTSGVSVWIAEGGVDRLDKIDKILGRHESGDWGDVCEEDRLANDSARLHEERLLSSYTVDGRELWVVTEADRSVTTILFPEEY